MNNQASVNITTAVDSLVSLVNERKRISMEEAAQNLGLPESIINEWASFLEEEHILGIEYKITTPFLVTVEDSKVKEERSTDAGIEKDLLIRKIQFMMASLEKYKINSTIIIKNKEELVKAINSGDTSRENKLYIQKMYLQIKLKELLDEVRNNKTEDLFRASQDVMVLEKRKKAFESNF